MIDQSWHDRDIPTSVNRYGSKGSCDVGAESPSLEI